MPTIRERSLVKYILLNLITLGIYGIVVFCQMGNDVNKICEGDNKAQMPYILALLLGLVTLGIYPIYWVYKAMNRLNDNAYRYGIRAEYSGSDYLLWMILGAWIFIGPFVAIHHYMKNLNLFSIVYDQVVPAAYSYDFAERASLKPVSKTNNFKSLGSSQQHNYSSNNYAKKASVDGSGKTDAYGDNKLRRGKLVCLSGDFEGASFPIQHNDIIKVGRSPSEANIIIEDNRASALHCTIKYDAEKNIYFVTDYSTNGTFMSSGRRLQPRTSTPLAVGAVIYIIDKANSFKLD